MLTSENVRLVSQLVGALSPVNHREREECDESALSQLAYGHIATEVLCIIIIIITDHAV